MKYYDVILLVKTNSSNRKIVQQFASEDVRAGIIIAFQSDNELCYYLTIKKRVFVF